MSEYSLAGPRLWDAFERWPFRQNIDAYIKWLQAEGSATGTLSTPRGLLGNTLSG